MQADKLHNEKILEILRKVAATDEVELVECKITPGSEQGENYSGIVLACDVTAKVNKEEKKFSWFAKMPILEPPMRMQMTRPMKIEEKEMDMYTRIIPAWKALIAERKADIQLNFCQLHHAEFHEDHSLGSLLVMQNMRSLGYRDAVNKKKGLHLGYVKLALEELAKFHALGYAHMRSYPGGIKEGLERNKMVCRDYFMAEPEEAVKAMFDKMNESGIGTMLTLLKSVQEPGQDFVGAFDTFNKARGAFAYRDKLYLPDPQGFNTLCHGDSWFSNMLFTHETMGDGSLNPTKACLVDLAMTRWSNPSTDLVYFFFLSTTPQLRRTHQQEMLGHYHDALVRNLHKLGEDPAVYPFRQLVKDYEKHSFIGFLIAMWILPMMICKKEDALSHEDMSDVNEEQMMKMFADTIEKAYANEPQIKLMMAGNFLEMVERGFFRL